MVPASPLAVASVSDQKRRQGRRRRYALRDDVQMLTGLRSVSACGRASTGGGVTLVRSAAGVARFTGLQTCGSIWACPVCSAKIRQARAEELERGLIAHLAAGGGLYMVTLTVRHGAGQRLASTLSTVQESWRKLAQGRSGVLRPRGVSAEAGQIIGTVRSTEVTVGSNGWHPHIHALVLTPAPLAPERLSGLSSGVFRSWCEAVTRRLGPSSSPTRDGFRFEEIATPEAIARYVAGHVDAKGFADARQVRSVSLEMSRADLKLASSGSRSPWQVAADAAALVREYGPGAQGHSFDLWREYEEATRGRRAMSWSKGLRAYLASIAEVEALERSDEELAAEEVAQDDDEVIVHLTHEAWAAILARRGMRAQLLDLAERPDGVEAVRVQLAALGCWSSG